MTETHAPFNGKKKEPAGVFIRLPISVSDAAAFKIKLSENHMVGDAILAIGTPVTGGEIDYEATVAHYEGKLAERDARIAELEAKLATESKRSFNAGYLIACCNLCNTHNEESIAADVLSQVDITQSEVTAMDLSEYDSNALQIIRRSRIPDPILKGPEA